MSAYVDELKQSRQCEADERHVVWIGDAHHNGTDVYWCDKLHLWVFVDLENRSIDFHDHVTIYRSKRDGDETGLNYTATHAAIDLDGEYGIWVVGHEEPEELEEEIEGVEMLWTSM